jgi:hypothetical protein
MRYEDLEIESILKLARAARDMERNDLAGKFNSREVLARIVEAFGQRRGITLLEILIDHDDRLADFHEHWKSWRSRCKSRRRRS